MGRIGGETPSDLGEAARQFAQHDAGLHAHRVAADVEDGTKMFAEIDDDPGAERFAGQTGSGAAGN
jgi:hypothetical protein